MAYSREKTLDSAQRCLSKGQFAKAAAHYNEVVQREPGDLRIWLRLADSYLRAENPSAAVRCFEHVGAAYEEDDDSAKALAVYRQAAAAEPERTDLLYKCAELYLALGRSAEAVEAYEEIAQGHINRGESDKAVALYAHIVKLEPRSVSRRLRLGEIYSREKRVDEAVEAFRESCKILLENEDYAQYIRVAERLLYHRNIDEVTRELIRVYLAVDQPRRALVKLNVLLRQNHADFEGLELLAETFLQMGRKEKALSVILELARAATGQGMEAQEAASRAVLRGLDELPDNPDLLRIGTELAESMPEEHEVDGLDEASQSQPLSAPAAGRATLSGREGPELDGIDIGQLAGLDLGIQAPKVGGVAAPLGGMPPEVERAIAEARVLSKYRLLDHAQAQLEPHAREFKEEPAYCDVQAEILHAQGEEEQAYRLRLGLAQRVAARDPEGARRLLDSILKVRTSDHAALSLLDQLEDTQPASQKFDELQTSNYDAIPPSAQAQNAMADPLQRSPDQPPGDFELEIDLEAPPVPSNAIASALNPVPEREQPAPSAQSRAEPSQASKLRNTRLDPNSAPPARAHTPARDLPSLDPPTGASADHGPIAEPPRTSFAAVGEGREASMADLFRPSAPNKGVQELAKGPLAADSEAPSQDLSIEEIEEFEEIEEILDFEEIEEIDDFEFDESEETPVQLQPSASSPAAKEPFSPAAAAIESLGAEPTEEEINELRFYLQEELHDEASELFTDLRVRFGDTHPALAPYFVHFGEAPPQQRLLSGARREGHEPLLSEDEADQALSALSFFPDKDSPGHPLAGEAPNPRPESEKDSIYDEEPETTGTKSAKERFDLALAYRDMGLVPNAVAELNACLRSTDFRLRAALLLAQIERDRAQLEPSKALLEKALAWTRTPEEIYDLRYELGLTLEQMSRPDEARRLWAELPPAYRDVQQRLARIG